jgi:hypothetical protein
MTTKKIMAPINVKRKNSLIKRKKKVVKTKILGESSIKKKESKPNFFSERYPIKKSSPLQLAPLFEKEAKGLQQKSVAGSRNDVIAKRKRRKRKPKYVNKWDKKKRRARVLNMGSFV